MSGVRCVVWHEWCEMTSVWDGWCEMNGVRWRRWVVYDGGRWVVRAEWWEMSGGRWVVRDEWWEMSVYVTCCMRWVRWVVWDVCVCDMLCERWMRWVVWDGGETWAMWDEWIKMSGVRWAVWERLPRRTFTQEGAKPACQEDITAIFLHLILAQLPRTTLTHSKAPNPHARKTSTQNVRTSYWHSYPEHSLHTASCQTRMPGRHQRKIFAPPIGTATPNTVYTQQAAKPGCQEDITVNVSHLLLAQLPRTQFTHSKAPNPHARKTSPQYFCISYWKTIFFYFVFFSGYFVFFVFHLWRYTTAAFNCLCVNLISLSCCQMTKHFTLHCLGPSQSDTLIQVCPGRIFVF